MAIFHKIFLFMPTKTVKCTFCNFLMQKPMFGQRRSNFLVIFLIYSIYIQFPHRVHHFPISAKCGNQTTDKQTDQPTNRRQLRSLEIKFNLNLSCLLPSFSESNSEIQVHLEFGNRVSEPKSHSK